MLREIMEGHDENQAIAFIDNTYLFNLMANKNMIRENEVNEMICSEVPSLAIDLSLLDRNKLYKAVSCLTDHTKELIREHRTAEILQCFQTAYELLHEGTSLVKLAMVSIYINSVSRLLEGSFCPEQCVKTDFLAKFGEEYYKLLYVKNP